MIRREFGEIFEGLEAVRVAAMLMQDGKSECETFVVAPHPSAVSDDALTCAHLRVVQFRLARNGRNGWAVCECDYDGNWSNLLHRIEGGNATILALRMRERLMLYQVGLARVSPLFLQSWIGDSSSPHAFWIWRQPTGIEGLTPRRLLEQLKTKEKSPC